MRFRTILAVVATLALVMLAASSGVVAYEARHQTAQQRRTACEAEVQAKAGVMIAISGIYERQDWEYDRPRVVVDGLIDQSVKCVATVPPRR